MSIETNPNANDRIRPSAKPGPTPNRRNKAARVGLTVAMAAVAAPIVVVAFGKSRFQQRVSREVADFIAAIPASEGPFALEPRLKDIPAPVARFLRQALGDRPMERKYFRLRHGGEFRLKPEQKWMSMEGEEYFRVDRPGYVWSATVHMAPLLYFDVRDFFWNGTGEVLAKIDSLITAAHATGPETARGALIRWAAEVPWGSPQGFLQSETFIWQESDARSAHALVRDPGGVQATVTYHFAPDGLLERMTTEDRELERDGKFVKFPYSAVYGDWRREQGGMVPYSAEAVWHLPEGDFNYVRVKLREIDYERRERFR